MISVQGRGAGRHTEPQHQMAKMQKTTGVDKTLSQKAIGRGRGKTPENCWLEERWQGGTLRGGRWHNHAPQTWCKSEERGVTDSC